MVCRLLTRQLRGTSLVPVKEERAARVRIVEGSREEYLLIKVVNDLSARLELLFVHNNNTLLPGEISASCPFLQ